MIYSLSWLSVSCSSGPYFSGMIDKVFPHVSLGQQLLKILLHNRCMLMFVLNCVFEYGASYFLLPTSYFLLPTSYFVLRTSYFLLPTSYFLLPTSYFLIPNSYFLLLTTQFLPLFPPTFLQAFYVWLNTF